MIDITQLTHKKNKSMTVRILGRGLALLLTIILAVCLPVAAGGVTVDISLTQPIGAENKMTYVQLKDVKSIQADFPPADAFDRAGISQTNALNQLEFTATLTDSGAGKGYIESSAPVGVVKFAPHTAALIAQANQTYSTDSEFAGDRSKPTQANSQIYKTQPGDTLLKIVQDRMTDERFSLQQKMIATLRANPEAFIENNINNLKTNEMLRLPDSNYIALVSREAARDEVARQYATWRELRAKISTGSSPQAAEIAVETPPQSKEPARLKEASEEGLEVRAPYQTDLQQDIVAAPDDTDVSKLQKQVDLMRARADSRQQEYEELSARNRELKEVIAQQDRLIKLQREEIAHLKQHSPEQVDVSDPDLPEEALLSTEPTESVKPTDSDEEQFPDTGEEKVTRGDTVFAMIDFFAIAFILSGLLFFIAGSIGLLRLPDVYSRLHALTKADNVGLGLIVTGVLLLASDWLVAVKLVLVWVLVLASSAASAHLIAQRALRQAEKAKPPVQATG
jgi:FimV-like protein